MNKMRSCLVLVVTLISFFLTSESLAARISRDEGSDMKKSRQLDICKLLSLLCNIQYIYYYIFINVYQGAK